MIQMVLVHANSKTISPVFQLSVQLCTNLLNLSICCLLKICYSFLRNSFIPTSIYIWSKEVTCIRIHAHMYIYIHTNMYVHIPIYGLSVEENIYQSLKEGIWSMKLKLSPILYIYTHIYVHVYMNFSVMKNIINNIQDITVFKRELGEFSFT